MTAGRYGMEGKVALVTGAGTGIGAGIAKCFAENGATVVIFDINGDAAEHMSRKIRDECHGVTLAKTGDVSRELDVKTTVEEVVAELGPLDILVNNAGIDVAGEVPALSFADWNRVLAVNLTGAFLFSKYVIPHMPERGGAIVNISSVHGFVSYEGYAAYDAAKAGMIAMTRALALDHGRNGIRANAICPGYIHTPMHDEWLEQQADPEATMKDVLKIHPLGRIGTPRDVAEAALFLASDASSFITGVYLTVDGGLTAGGR